MLNTEEFKKQVVFNVGETAKWRSEKAEEHPDDERNAAAANELSELEKDLDALFSDDPWLQRIWRAEKVLFADESYPTEELNRFISRTGFDRSADLDTFLGGYLGILMSAVMKDTGNAKKTWENKLRRIAQRQGYRLEKSRRRDIMSPDYGTYRIVSLDSGFVAHAAWPKDYGLDLDDVEEWLTSE